MLKNQCTIPQIRDPFGSLFSRLLETPMAAPPNTDLATSRTTPRTNVAETETSFELSFELPGIDEQDLEVQLQDKTLTVTAERKDVRDGTSDKRWHRTEHLYGVYKRAIRLPSDASDEGVEAVYKAGVLTVTIQKCAKAQPAKIPVRTA